MRGKWDPYGCRDFAQARSTKQSGLHCQPEATKLTLHTEVDNLLRCIVHYLLWGQGRDHHSIVAVHQEGTETIKLAITAANFFLSRTHGNKIGDVRLDHTS